MLPVNDSRMTRRRFLSASAAAMGSAMVSPLAVGQQSAANGTFTWTLTSAGKNGKPDCIGDPVPVSIAIAAGQPIRTMQGGTGASFHAISAVLPGMRADGTSRSGSAWGGNPEADDDAHWNELFQYADWLGLDWCRVEIEQRMYEPEKRAFTWDNPEMRVLYRILDWAQRRGVDVFLQQMWADVAWNAYPGNADDPTRRLRSAPYSIAEWAYGLGELLHQLVQVKGYTCIRWFSIVNEPGHDDFSWWQDSNMKSVSIVPGLQAARAEFDRRGIAVPISGPDWTDISDFKPAQVDFDQYIGAYDLHSYNSVFDSFDPMRGQTLSKTEQQMADWAQWAHSKDKPFFLSEFGTMSYGWGHVDGGPACYQSGLKNASLAVRGINVGVDGFNRWSFTNRGDLDGQWQLVRTWDVDRNRLLDKFTPQPNAYYQYAMLSRFLSKHSGVLATSVKAPFLPMDRKVVATALRSPKGNLTILVVNESYRAADVSIDLENLSTQVQLHRYAVTPAIEGRCWVELKAEQSGVVDGSMLDTIPPLGIVAYSTYLLNPQDDGIVSG